MVILLRRFTIALLVFAGLLLGLSAPALADPDDGQWDPTLPKLISSGAPGDPLAIANASLAATTQATQVTMDLGRKFLSSLGLAPPAASSAGVAPGRVHGPQAIEYVIRRGASQMGVPYSWGGGKPTGPTTGIDSGANTVGFDCSGFTQFVYAQFGVSLPHSAARQGSGGTAIAASAALPGDIVAMDGGGHVGIYLGGNSMIDAPEPGKPVQIRAIYTSAHWFVRYGI